MIFKRIFNRSVHYENHTVVVKSVMKIGSDFLRIEFQIYIKFFFVAFEWQIVVQL